MGRATTSFFWRVSNTSNKMSDSSEEMHASVAVHQRVDHKVFLFDGIQDIFQADGCRDVFAGSFGKPLRRIWAIDDRLHFLLDPWPAHSRNAGHSGHRGPLWELVLCFCFCVQEQDTHLSVYTQQSYLC